MTRAMITAAVLSATAPLHSAAADRVVGVYRSTGGGGFQAAGLYSVDINTGDTAFLGLADAGAAQNNASGPNGLASRGSVYYYSTFNGVGDSSLYGVDLGGTDPTPSLVATLSGPVASGSVYQGGYYYFLNGSGRLYRVELDPPHTLALVRDFGGSLGFGDIAIRSDGVLFGSSSVFFRVDLHAPQTGLVVIDAGHAAGQIAFVGDRLIQFTGGNIFELDQDDGTPTIIGSSAFGPNDLASFTLGCNPADLAEPFGLHDLADINAFTAGFVAMDPIADLAPDGLFDLGDINLFVTSFLAGCP